MAGLYIHIPFCKSRCRYCDFFSTTQLEKRALYTEALLCEWETRQHELTEAIHTIYIGGGTPSTLECAELSKIISFCRAESPVNEITMEVNPGDVTQERALAWRAMGINRLSIGIQSFNDPLLQLIGRRHSAQEALDAVAIAQAAGFDNISIDLMYALPTEKMEQWQQDVEQALNLGIQHLSTYGLIYEDNTTLTHMLQRGEIDMVDEDTEMQMYDYLVERMVANGFKHYEVSNFALPERQSQHNSNYWNDTPYMGLGAGAHSYNGLVRKWNINDLDSYIQQALTHRLQPETEELTPEERHTERVMLSLRTSQGVAIDEIDISRAEPYIAQGLLTRKGNRIAATTQGFHILNRIIEELI